MILGSGGDQPNTDSYQNGVLTPTGISIEVLSDPGFLMIIRVSGFNSRSTGLMLDPSKGSSIAADDDSSAASEDFESDNSVKTAPVVLRWMLAMFSGLGLMLGLAVIFL